MNNIAISLWSLVALTAVALSSSPQQTASNAPGKKSEYSTESLVDDLTTYFQTDDAKKRKQIANAIKESTDGNWQHVAQKLRDLNLWEDLSRHGSFPVEFISPTGETRSVQVELPSVYDSGVAHPLYLREFSKPIDRDCLVGPAPIQSVKRQKIQSAIVATVTSPLNQWHLEDGAAAGDLQAMLIAIRKKLHVDSDRTYLVEEHGYGVSSWISASMHADFFAGALFKQSIPCVPFPNQVYPIVLTNLSNLPTYIGWDGWTKKKEDEIHELGKSTFGIPVDSKQYVELKLAVTRHNEAVAATHKVVTQHMALIASHAESMELRLVAHDEDEWGHRMEDRQDLDDRLDALFSSPRNLLEPKISHWFRYLPQGHDRWLRVTKMTDGAWTSEQLSILPSPTGDADDFITEVIKDKLGYIGGTIEGQHIKIETQRCARVEIILYDGLIDWQKPVTVTINGIKRSEKVIKPTIPTLLESAYNSWDFQHAVGATLSFSIAPKAKR